MMDVPTHRSRQFLLRRAGIILLTVAIRLPSLLHPQPIDSEADVFGGGERDQLTAGGPTLTR